MTRTFAEDRLLVASHNSGKVREIADLLAPFGVETTSAGALGLPEPEETGKTFIANAVIKAQAAALGSGMTAVGDDSGLVVPSLDGQPGLYSARWAGPDRDFSVAMEKIETLLREQGATGPEDRRAHFVCALSLAWPDGHTETFEGRVDGHLIWPPRGDLGFGYDPMFVPEGHAMTFGEMEPPAKHAMSHRANAFRKMIEGCFGR